MSDQVGNQNVGFLMTRLIFVPLVTVSVRALLSTYNWAHVSIIYDEFEVFYREAAPSMVSDFELDEDFPMAYPVPFKSNHRWNPKELLVAASKHARGTLYVKCMWHMFNT